jgi:hypothetical protein
MMYVTLILHLGHPVKEDATRTLSASEKTSKYAHDKSTIVLCRQ